MTVFNVDIGIQVASGTHRPATDDRSHRWTPDVVAVAAVVQSLLSRYHQRATNQSSRIDTYQMLNHCECKTVKNSKLRGGGHGANVERYRVRGANFSVFE